MNTTRNNLDAGGRPGHLNATWEVAVVSSCILVFVIAISVVIYQARRQRRLRQKNPEVVQVRSSRRHSSRRHSGKKVAKDLESGPEQPIEITNPGKVENDGYIDDDDEGDEGQPEDRKSKRSPPPIKSTSKSGRSKKHSSSKSSESSTSDSKHPSQNPPRYYWSYR